MRKIKTNTLAKNKAKYAHQEKMARIQSPEKIQKMVEKTKKYEAKMRKAGKAAAVKTVSRSSAVAASATSSSLADAEKSKHDANQAKYMAVITGNVQGENAVDSEKTGSKGSKENLGTNNVSGFTGW